MRDMRSGHIGVIAGAVLAAASLHVQALVAQPQSPATTEPIALVWTKPGFFWFRQAVPGGHIYLNVDAEHGVKEPLFDHQRLAIELNLRTGYEYTPVTLPFADPAARFVVKYDGSNAYIQEGAMAVEFILDATHWRCELQVKWDWNKVPPTDYECLPRRPAAPGQAAIAPPSTVRSPDGKWEALIQDHNVAVRPAATTAAVAKPLSTDGTATFAYHAGSIRWSPDSRTLTAYRVDQKVWLSESITGHVKGLVAASVWTIN
jgi:hypothetical protein